MEILFQRAIWPEPSSYLHTVCNKMQVYTYGFGSSGNEVSGLYILAESGNFICAGAKELFMLNLRFM